MFNIPEERETRFESYRCGIIASTSIAISLDLFSAFLILFRSPSQFGKYKYVLLNIVFWAFLIDVTMLLFLPFGLAEVFGGYATGLVRFLGPFGGFAFLTAALVFILEGFVALLFAFLYRYFTLKDATTFTVVRSRRVFYNVGICVLLVVPSGTAISPWILSYLPAEAFKKAALEIQPDLLPFFDRFPVFGVAFDKQSLIACGFIFTWITLWVISVILALTGVLRRLKSMRCSMNTHAYRMHVQLIRTLVVQTAAPMILFALPILAAIVMLLLKAKVINDLLELAMVSISFHSIVNSLALMILIVPYKRAICRMFRRVSPWKTSVIAVSAIVLHFEAVHK